MPGICSIVSILDKQFTSILAYLKSSLFYKTLKPHFSNCITHKTDKNNKAFIKIICFLRWQKRDNIKISSLSKDFLMFLFLAKRCQKKEVKGPNTDSFDIKLYIFCDSKNWLTPVGLEVLNYLKIRFLKNLYRFLFFRLLETFQIAFKRMW